MAVCGTGAFEPEACAQAEEVGARLARSGAIVLCGGLGGVMESVCKGARSEGGLTIGLLPGGNHEDANPYVDVAIPTGMGEMRNALIVRAADAVIAISGGFGTLSEVGLALRIGKPVVGLDTWELMKGGEKSDAITIATGPEDAVALALELA